MFDKSGCLTQNCFLVAGGRRTVFFLAGTRRATHACVIARQKTVLLRGEGECRFAAVISWDTR